MLWRELLDVDAIVKFLNLLDLASSSYKLVDAIYLNYFVSWPKSFTLSACEKVLGPGFLRNAGHYMMSVYRVSTLNKIGGGTLRRQQV